MKIILLFCCIMLLNINADGKENEQQAIAWTIAAEAAGEGKIGMKAVACTIKNRALKYNKTPYEIISEPNQYYGYTAKNRMKRYNEVREYVDYLANNIMKLEDITGGAIYFETYRKEPLKWWGVFTVKIKNHYFYK